MVGCRMVRGGLRRDVGAVVTGVAEDLATLREYLLTPPGKVGVVHGQDAYEALDRVEAELSRLRGEESRLNRNIVQYILDAEQAQLERDEWQGHYHETREALAEATASKNRAHARAAAMERVVTTALRLARYKRPFNGEAFTDLQQAVADYLARVALAGPDTLTAGEPGVAPDGTGRVATADGCAERQSTADPSPAASAPETQPAAQEEA